MQATHFEEALARVVASDPRYHRDAYLFLREGLESVHRPLAKERKVEACHVSGQQLLAGLRDYALHQYGPMAKTVLNEWGVQRGEDFGEIVFIMVEHGLLSKTDKDSRDDFKGGYDFVEAFCKPFWPQARREEKELLPPERASQSAEC